MGKLLDGALANRLSKIRNIINAKAGSNILTNENEIKTAETLQKFFYSGDEPQYNWIFIKNSKYHSASYFTDIMTKSLPAIGYFNKLYDENGSLYIPYGQIMSTVTKFDWSKYRTLYIEYWVWDENSWNPPYIDIYFLDRGTTYNSQTPKAKMLSHGTNNKSLVYEDDVVVREVSMKYMKFSIPENLGDTKLCLRSLGTRNGQKFFIYRLGVN